MVSRRKAVADRPLVSRKTAFSAALSRRSIALAATSTALSWTPLALAQAPAPTAAPPSTAPASTPAAPTNTAPATPARPAAEPSAPQENGKATVKTGGSSDRLMPEEHAAAGTTPSVDVAKDEEKLVDQGRERPMSDGTIGSRPMDVYSEDWWGRTRPMLEMHGYFRTRGELFHNFSLGRHSLPDDRQALWPNPLDNSYSTLSGERRSVLLCGNDGTSECADKTQATANLRLRLNPEVHISDNLRILSQVDLLDNLVLGSTPDSYAMKPGANGYQPSISGYRGYAPASVFSNTQGPPTAGVNSYQNSIAVQRAWAEYVTPIGELRFGRMPHHWGLGMLYNAGNCIDCDYQTNIDRIQFVSGLKSLDLYAGGSWDFISTGPTTQSPYDVYGGQPYNTANIANVNQWSAFIVKRTNPDLQRMKLSRGDVVINGGIYASYRSQTIDLANGQTPLTYDSTAINNGLERRGAHEVVPDLWIQLLWSKLRLEAEVASIWGSLENSTAGNRIGDPIKIRQWGLATQAEYRAVEDKLRIQFGGGWASGDSNVEGLAPGSNGLQDRLGAGPISTFRFHPAYYVDLIFFRRILSRVEGAYYFRPSVEYDFMRNPNGQKFGGGAAVIWSRASQYMQTPGNKRDLGVELDFQLYYQSKDGSLNDDPNKMGGFYSALQYGVFFPLGGLDYLPGERGTLAGTSPLLPSYDLSTAQTIRLILGVMF